MYTAIEINQYLEQKIGKKNTKVKRQKLLYFAQAWHLAWYGTPLFNDDICAWDMGPVTVNVWQAEKEEPSSKLATLDAETCAHLEAILDYYGSKTGSELSDITHADLPWKQTYELKKNSSFVNDVIPKNAMFSFYSSEKNAPTKPDLVAEPVGEDDFEKLLSQTSTRLAGVDRLLADR